MNKKFMLLVAGLIISASAMVEAQLGEVVLKNDQLKLVVTPDAGGRILSFSLIDHPNFLKTTDAIKRKPLEKVDEKSPFIPYFGHEVWFGPQTGWWTNQSLSPARKKQKAIWPPDPFSSMGANQVVEQTPHKLILKSAASPINGLEIEKTFALVDKNPLQVDLWVKATNARQKAVAWDIWFNTRTSVHTRIYAPVDDKVKVRRLDFGGSVPYVVENGLLRLQSGIKKTVQGKILFQPTAGWYAAFNQQQVLIVQFPLLPVEKIHPEHGQLEFYLDYNPSNIDAGVLEMEVHAAFTRLNPGEEMQARERWTLIEYKGDDSVESQQKFLREQLKNLDAI